MLRLKLIPRAARLLSGRPSGCYSVHSRFLCAGNGAGGDDGNDDFLSQYLGGTVGSDDRASGAVNRGVSQRPSASFGGPGRSGWAGRGGSSASSRTTGLSWESYVDDDENPDDIPISEEDLKLKQELEARLAESVEKQKKEEPEEEEEEEKEEEEEVKSIYTGFIDPKHDDLIKVHKQKLKRLRYKEQVYVTKKERPYRDPEDEDLDDLYRDSDDERATGRGRRASAKGGKAFDLSEDEDDGSEYNMDEDELEAVRLMDSRELEKHLKHREHARKLEKEYNARIADLGDKASDEAEVEKVQRLIMKKWRAHYRIPRLLTPLEKEEMWKKHKEDPKVWTVEKLAEEYNCFRARVHAILWLWEMRKHRGESRTAEEETKEYLDELACDEYGKPILPPHMGEDKWVTTWYTKPNYKIMPEDWEGSVRSEEEAIDEASAKEEQMMLNEMLDRMEFNKLQIAGLIKVKQQERRRPPEGWSYVVEKLGPEGKRGKRGGVRFVATADGRHRRLNELEKFLMRREAVRPRRKIL